MWADVGGVGTTNAFGAKEWKADAPWSVHNIHQYDSDCAVCREDVPAMLAVAVEAAAPILAGHIASQIRAQRPAGNTPLTFEAGINRAAKIAREAFPTRTAGHPNGDPT